MLRKTLTDAMKPVVDLVYPPRCPLCGDALGEQGGLCLPCWETLAIPRDPACKSCSEPMSDADVDQSICAPCAADPSQHDGIAAATIYNDASRKLVLNFKHGRRIALASLMARLMARRLGEIAPDTLVMPVPLHRTRLWHRGFNQSALLAREIAARAGGKLVVDGLRRIRATPSLGGLSRQARQRTLAGVIAVSPKWVAKMENASVVLVDDVLTSGATTNACVAALKGAGAQLVVICCFSRVTGDHAAPATAEHHANRDQNTTDKKKRPGQSPGAT